MNSSFSMSGGTVKDCSAAADGLAASDGAADGAVDGADEAGAALCPPPPLQAARNAAVADIALARMKPLRLSGVCSSRQRIWRTYRSMSWSDILELLLPGRPGHVRPHPARMRFASSCHRTTTGSPGPTPGAPPAPA